MRKLPNSKLALSLCCLVLTLSNTACSTMPRQNTILGSVIGGVVGTSASIVAGADGAAVPVVLGAAAAVGGILGNELDAEEKRQDEIRELNLRHDETLRASMLQNRLVKESLDRSLNKQLTHKGERKTQMGSNSSGVDGAVARGTDRSRGGSTIGRADADKRGRDEELIASVNDIELSKGTYSASNQENRASRYNGGSNEGRLGESHQRDYPSEVVANKVINSSVLKDEAPQSPFITPQSPDYRKPNPEASELEISKQSASFRASLREAEERRRLEASANASNSMESREDSSRQEPALITFRQDPLPESKNNRISVDKFGLSGHEEASRSNAPKAETPKVDRTVATSGDNRTIVGVNSGAIAPEYSVKEKVESSRRTEGLAIGGSQETTLSTTQRGNSAIDLSKRKDDSVAEQGTEKVAKKDLAAQQKEDGDNLTSDQRALARLSVVSSSDIQRENPKEDRDLQAEMIKSLNKVTVDQNISVEDLGVEGKSEASAFAKKGQSQALSEECVIASKEAGKAVEASGTSTKLFHLRRSLRLCPENAEYHERLGDVYSSVGRTTDALYEYKEALKLSPQRKDGLQKKISRVQ